MRNYSSSIQRKHSKHKGQPLQRPKLWKWLSTTEKLRNVQGSWIMMNVSLVSYVPLPFVCTAHLLLQILLWQPALHRCNPASAFCLSSTTSSSFLLQVYSDEVVLDPCRKFWPSCTCMWQQRTGIQWKDILHCTLLVAFPHLKKKKKKNEKKILFSPLYFSIFIPPFPVNINSPQTLGRKIDSVIWKYVLVPFLLHLMLCPLNNYFRIW